MVRKPRTNMSVAIVTFNNHFGNTEFVVENGNGVKILQGPGHLERNCNSTDKKKLYIVHAALRQLKSMIDKFEKIIVYLGDGLSYKIIKLVSKCGLPAEKVLFFVSADEWKHGGDEVYISSSNATSKVVKYQEDTSKAIWNLYRNILRDGMLPQ